MHPVAIEKAKSRLRVAKKALEDVKKSHTMESFHDAWYSFLTAAKNIYTMLQEGAKTTTPQSRQWYGEKARQRIADPLLHYLYEARNDDEHGLTRNTRRVPEKLGVGVARPGYSLAVAFDAHFGGRGQFTYRARSLDGKPILVEHSPAYVALAPVSARGNRTVMPPATHLGKPVTDNSPEGVAELAVVYLEGLIEEASKLA